jgi:hypothetical protein
VLAASTPHSFENLRHANLDPRRDFGKNPIRSVAPVNLMNLTAVFESWHIGDGNYPPLSKGEFVNLSFELEPRKMEEVNLGASEGFEHLGKGEYRWCGTVLKVYEGEGGGTVVIIRTGDFSFYLLSQESDSYVQGRRYSGEGTLLLDHYSWVEWLDEYEDPPDLFFKLSVERILKVNIPEKFVARHETGKSFPTLILPEDYSASDVEEIDTMEGQPFDEEFYIIDFISSGLDGRDIPRTFIS